jgi:hypothetical protein
MVINPVVANVVEELVKSVEDNSDNRGPTITDIPPDVLKEFILPHLDMKALGSLSMVSTLCKDTCDDNEVWKREYLKTIRCVITDESKHVRQKSVMPLYKNMLPETFAEKYRAGCLPKNVRDKIPSWASVKEPHELAIFGTHTRPYQYRAGGITFEYSYAGPEEKRYKGIIKDVWTKHNRENGLSTVNRCQCLKHYSFETLGVPGSCRNFKSYKRMLLKKKSTVLKKEVAPIFEEERRAGHSLDCSRGEIERLKGRIKVQEREVEEAQKKSQKSQNLLDNLKMAVDTL